MPKKFKNPEFDALPATPGLQSTLPDYIRGYAPDVIQGLDIMEGAGALRFWQEIFQPPQSGEGKRLINTGLRWPYAERLVYLAREFAKLEPRSQRYIVKAARAQIWWRGDDIQRFQSIVAAHQRYRGLSDDERLHYKRQLMTVARGLLSKPVPLQKQG